MPTEFPLGSGRGRRLSPLTGYGIAVAAAAAATLLRVALDPTWGAKLPLILFYPAIMVAAWLGGFGPGFVTTLLCAAAADYFWMAPVGSLALEDVGDFVGLVVFIVIGAVISGLNEAWRRAAAALAESEDRLRVTLASIGDAVIATDEQGRVTRLNAVARELTGWTEKEAAGRPLGAVFSIVDESSRAPAESPIVRALREGAVSGFENHTVLLSKDSREIPIDYGAAPIRAADGRTTGAVIVFRDVTQRRRLERERAALLENEHTARVDAEAAEQHLRFALQAGHMGTWQWTIATGEVTWSPGLEAIHGYAPGGFPGTFDAFQSEIHPEDRDRVLRALSEAMAQRCDHDVEYRIVRADGSVRWVEGRGQLFSDAEGQPDCMVGVCADVTERKHSEEKFRLAVEAAPAAVLIVDARGAILVVNALAESLLGYARDELVGQSIEQLVPERFRRGHAQLRSGFFGDSRRRPMGAGRELYALCKNGSEVPVEIGLSPFETSDGTLVMAAITDITERKRTAALLEAAVRARDDFLSIASHELRNPVNAVHLQFSAVLRALERDADAVNQGWLRERIGQASIQVRRLVRLIDNLLDVSRIGAGPIVLDPETVDFREVVQAVLEQSNDELKEHEVTLLVSKEAVVGQWDRLRLEQVVSNLVSNAVKYGNGAPIAIALEGVNGSARFSVTDHGIGIDREKQARLFARFERAVSGAKYGGFGLGLWITRQIVDAMRGEISVESQPGRGSTFSVLLPLNPSAMASEKLREGSAERPRW